MDEFGGKLDHAETITSDTDRRGVADMRFDWLVCGAAMGGTARRVAEGPQAWADLSGC